MGNFKVVKGFTKPELTPIDEWTSHHFIWHFKELYQKRYSIEPRRTEGQLLIFINQKNIDKLFRQEGRTISIHPRELYRDYLEWVIKEHEFSSFKMQMLSDPEMMSQFLENRARKNLGDFDDFQKQEAERVKRAQEFFNKER